jgi:hypothetical protein
MKMSKLYDTQISIIDLNVGGTKFTTSIETLQEDKTSMLCAMFSGKYQIQEDNKGRYFIDRDATHFPKILNFLRTGTLVTPLSNKEIKELMLEAEYYNLR